MMEGRPPKPIRLVEIEFVLAKLRFGKLARTDSQDAGGPYRAGGAASHRPHNHAATTLGDPAPIVVKDGCCAAARLSIPSKACLIRMHAGPL